MLSTEIHRTPMIDYFSASVNIIEQGISDAGLVGPFLAFLAMLMLAETCFLVALLFVPKKRIDREVDFLRHLKRANMMLSGVAVVSGFIGTYAGLVQMLPALGEVMGGSGAEASMPVLMSGLSSAFVSSMIGLGVGGVFGHVNDFLFTLVLPVEDNLPAATNAASEINTESAMGQVVEEDPGAPVHGVSTRGGSPLAEEQPAAIRADDGRGRGDLHRHNASDTCETRSASQTTVSHHRTASTAERELEDQWVTQPSPENEGDKTPESSYLLDLISRVISVSRFR